MSNLTSRTRRQGVEEYPISAVAALPYPATIVRGAVVWPYAVGIGLYHLLAPLAFVPWFFSWSGLVLAIAGLYVFGTLGINLCYHRILTHQGLVVPKWLEHIFATLGICCMEDTPAHWVTVHRLHHQYSDEQPDPHSPLVTFLWGHMGWLFVNNRETGSIVTYERYAKDILKDPYYLAMERNLMWVWINLGQWLLFFTGGAICGYALTHEFWPALQLGLSVWLWGVIVRTVAVWHITWSVNSLAHIWGYQSYNTGENSRNNWFVAWISNGEGWHNNHHADQRAAAHGHQWWEFDVTWRTIRALEMVGLAKEVVQPQVWRRSAP